MTDFTIYNDHPSSWRDLQIRVAAILSDIGYICTIERDIDTVRGKVNIDVYAEKTGIGPSQVILAECKYWTANVPKSVVHSFRTVVGDSGANYGYIVSKTGFQSGAIEAVDKSNVSLLTWDEFQEFFKAAWLYAMINKNHVLGKSLMDFTDYMGDFYDKEYDLLSDEKKEAFHQAQIKYSKFSFYSHKDYVLNYVTGEIEYLDQAIQERKENLPIEIKCYKDYFYFIRDYCNEGLKEIDSIFGKQVRKGCYGQI